jgi:hypothetical protein
VNCKQKSGATEVIKGRPLPPGLSVKLGNECATDVGKGGPGAGRKLYGQSGSNQTYGEVNPGASRPGANKPIFPGFK